MNATVTLYRYYFKSIEIEVDKDHLKGLTKEEKRRIIGYNKKLKRWVTKNGRYSLYSYIRFQQ